MTQAKESLKKFYISFFLAAAALAGGVSFYASSSPDGLEKVAEDEGFLETAKDSAVSFIAFALLMPFFGQGERVEFLGLLLYQEGIEAGVGIIAKATLGVLTAILLSATTTAREILRGLEILKVPTLLVQIASFMLRYLNVVTDEMERMRVARASRGFQETGIKHWKVLANSAGALFIRSYERGERVHLAMLSRGYTGTLPKIERVSVTKSQILYGLSLPLSAGLCLLISISI
ncbi:MAG: cobalt ECF transporter T component CbiQ [Actinobacteria bacterium]|nr:cobalt ECF transporter T component CbiQ [Actinomycetota bacterium]